MDSSSKNERNSVAALSTSVTELCRYCAAGDKPVRNRHQLDFDHGHVSREVWCDATPVRRLIELFTATNDEDAADAT